MIRYRELRHWRYVLDEPYTIETPIKGFRFPHGDDGDDTDDVEDRFFFRLERDGSLVIRAGYCWDGPSGPVWQSPSSLRPALVHDVFYQLMRIGELPVALREKVDELFHRMCLEAGMGKFRAWYFWKAVRWFGYRAATEREPYPRVQTAP